MTYCPIAIDTQNEYVSDLIDILVLSFAKTYELRKLGLELRKSLTYLVSEQVEILKRVLYKVSL